MNIDASLAVRASLAHDLRAARELAGLTQLQVAERLGVRLACVSEREAGLKRATVGYAQRVLVACGLPESWVAPAPDPERQRRFEAATQELVERHGGLLRRLAE